MKLLTGDQVLVTSGRDKGQKGPIEKVFPRKARVRVTGINLYKRARKGFGASARGGMIEFARPLPVASVSLICPKCGKQTRVGYTVDKKGEKTRICKKCKASLNGGKK